MRGEVHKGKVVCKPVYIAIVSAAAAEVAARPCRLLPPNKGTNEFPDSKHKMKPDCERGEAQSASV